jgi:hypothetical protein
MFSDWSRTELLQLGGIGMAGVATIVGLIVKKNIAEIHVLINSRVSQLIAASEAKGQVKERAEADAREVSGLSKKV